jgi:hypothetical protein
MNIKVINLKTSATLEYSERIEKNWIINWGENNNYPIYLQSLLDKSSKHNAIVKSKAMMIGSSGFIKPQNPVNKSLYDNKWNIHNLNEILNRVSYDFEVYGQFALNLIWSNDRKTISEINYIDMSKVRIMAPTVGNRVDYFMVSQDWNSLRRNKPVVYPAFSTKDRSNPSQIVVVKDYRPGTEWYSLPEYISAKNYIELEYEISQFHLSSVQNGFAPSLMINFSSQVPSTEEMETVIRSLKKEYEGTRNAGKVIFTFSDGSQNAPQITPINSNNSDERFIQLNKEVTDAIMAGHRVVNPSLFGIKESGELGAKNTILESMDIFIAQYIKPKQNQIVEVFNKIAKINGGEDFQINKFKIDTTFTPEVSDVLSILQAPILTSQKEEIFKLLGYDEESIKKLIGTNEQ